MPRAPGTNGDIIFLLPSVTGTGGGGALGTRTPSQAPGRALSRQRRPPRRLALCSRPRAQKAFCIFKWVGGGGDEYFVTCEKSTKFQFQSSQIHLRGRSHLPVYRLCTAAFVRQRPSGPRGLRHLLPGPLRTTSARPCSGRGAGSQLGAGGEGATMRGGGEGGSRPGGVFQAAWPCPKSHSHRHGLDAGTGGRGRRAWRHQGGDTLGHLDLMAGKS